MRITARNAENATLEGFGEEPLATVSFHSAKEATSMNILISGSSGLLGTALMPVLHSAGHDVVRLVRSARPATSPPAVTSAKARDIFWNPESDELNAGDLEGIDAIVHLAGDSIAARWTPEKKARIRTSRVAGTRLLAARMALMKKPPKVFVSASAIGYYGDRGDEIMTEDSQPGTSFLSHVCREWEAATQVADALGIRTVHLRIGVVLSQEGGALAQMLFPFRMGVGGRLGSGRQYMSWISIDDLLGAIQHVLATESLSGAVNAVAPAPVTNAVFTKTLGKVLRRPTLFPVPAFAVRLLFGEMGQELLLGSTRVEPSRLIRSGYAFRHPALEGALRFVLHA
jgi:uncharacterized protein